jgi:hypothetical protein
MKALETCSCNSLTKQRPTLGKTAHFSCNNPAGFFVKRDKLLSKLIKFKYENIKKM